MVFCTGLAIFLAVLVSFEATVHRSSRLAADFLDDVESCRRALDRIEMDIRVARRVEYLGQLVQVHLPDRIADYTLEDGVLSRRSDGQEIVVARRIGAFNALQDGRLVRVRIELMPRSSAGRPAVVRSSVYLRNGGLE
jgi:hypothetical protein